MAFTVGYIDGAEWQTRASYENGSIVQSSDQVFKSNNSWDTTSLSAGTAYLNLRAVYNGSRDVFVGSGASWYGFHLYIDTLPGSGQFMYLMGFDAGADGGVRINENGAVQTTFGSAGWNTASGGQMETGKWYQVSINYDRDVECRCIVREIGDATELINSVQTGAGSSAVAQARIGAYTSSHGRIYFDNIVTSVEDQVGAGNADDPFVGLGNITTWAINLLLPNATGTYDEWTGSYADMDETPSDGDTTHRESPGVFGGTEKDITENFEDTSKFSYKIKTIKSLQLQGIIKGDGAGTGHDGEFRLVINSTDYDEGTTIVETTSYEDFGAYYMVNPDTSVAWTESDVDNMEAGINHFVGTGKLRCTALSIELLYEPLDEVGSQIIWMT